MVLTAPVLHASANNKLDRSWRKASRSQDDGVSHGGLIASLPKDQAEAVMLRVVAGLDVAQTAQVLDKRTGAVRVAAMRGLRRLAQHAEVQARRKTAGPARLNSPRPGEV